MKRANTAATAEAIKNWYKKLSTHECEKEQNFECKACNPDLDDMIPCVCSQCDACDIGAPYSFELRKS